MPLTPEQNLSNIREVFGWNSDAATICKLGNERDKLREALERLADKLDSANFYGDEVDVEELKVIARQALETP